MSLPSQAWTEIDFDRNGRQVGHVFIPYSVNRSAYGNVAIPIVVLSNGEGPTVLLTAGNHGDEFEGQIIATRIARRLETSHIRGRLIVIPCLNFPAAVDGSRVSPLDGGNLNRSFPGDSIGTVTQQIAHYLHKMLMPMADVVIDLHSGGISLDYMPTAFINLAGKPELDTAVIAAMQAFGAPLTMVFKEDGETRRAFSSAHANDCIYLCTELGGGGCVSSDALSIGYAGTVRALIHFDLLANDAALLPIRHAEKTRFVQVPSRLFHIYASAAGIFEPAFRLGSEVRAGQLAGLTYSQNEPDREPSPSYFQADGFVICRRHPAQVQAGDCLAHIAVDFDAGS